MKKVVLGVFLFLFAVVSPIFLAGCNKKAEVLYYKAIASSSSSGYSNNANYVYSGASMHAEDGLLNVVVNKYYAVEEKAQKITTYYVRVADGMLLDVQTIIYGGSLKYPTFKDGNEGSTRLYIDASKTLEYDVLKTVAKTEIDAVAAKPKVTQYLELTSYKESNTLMYISGEFTTGMIRRNAETKQISHAYLRTVKILTQKENEYTTMYHFVMLDVNENRIEESPLDVKKYLHEQSETPMIVETEGGYKMYKQNQENENTYYTFKNSTRQVFRLITA